MGRMAGESETCGKCGASYDVVWAAPDYLWAKVTGKADGSGCLCPSCFHEMAWEKGVTLYWGCAEGAYPVDETLEALQLLRWLRTSNRFGGPALRLRAVGEEVAPISEELATKIDLVLARYRLRAVTHPAV